MKRTHKLRALDVEAVQNVLRTAGSVAAAAKTLRVNRSTVHRWLKAGAVTTGQGTGRRTDGAGETTRPQTARGWARAIRRDYQLSATEQQLVTLAAQALDLAHTADRPADRLAAMGRFQMLVKQLNLEAADDGEAQTTTEHDRRWPRPA